MVDFAVPGPGRLLLVSDGLWNYAIEPSQLVVAIGEEPLERLALARRLVTFANESGGSDNITVVVIDPSQHELPRRPSPRTSAT